MIHTLPKGVSDALALRYQASKQAEALYQQELALVTQMLGVPEGARFSLNFETGELTVEESS